MKAYKIWSGCRLIRQNCDCELLFKKNTKMIFSENFCFYFVIFLPGVISSGSEGSKKFYDLKNSHPAKNLNSNEVVGFAQLTDMDHFRTVLNQILIPRVVGTPEHKQVGDFIADSLKKLDWSVEEQTFTDYTPIFGNLQFRNIVATLNPNADRYLVLACHYDSKYTREHVFVGATDSAVPCAMLINLAKTMAKQLEAVKTTPLSLMLIFFDGEEAFRQWGPKDSIYGARYMAQKWQQTPFKGVNQLKRMDMLVLLDLLGAPDPVFYSYFQSTERWYTQLANAEASLSKMNQLTGYSNGQAEQTYFRLRSSHSFVEDDHLPFLKRNVDILHVIPSPFPEVWHKPTDNLQALDFNTIENLNKIFRIFVAEYLHLEL